MTDENERPSANIPQPPSFLKSSNPAATPVPTPEPAPVPAIAEAVDQSATNYGLVDSLKQGKTELSENLKEFMDKVGTFLSKAIDDATSLEVKTYVTEDLSAVQYQNKEFTGGVKLRALTRVNIDGDTLVCVPEVDGELDTAVWGIHMEMTKQAQTARAEFMKTVIQAVTGLSNLLPKP
jgi:hypothetical protein